MPLAGCVNQNFPFANAPAPPGGYYGVSSALYYWGFINLFRFLSGTCAPMGVVLREYHVGDGGSGMNYFSDSFKPHGDYAWYVFEFTQADPPFWLHAVCRLGLYGYSPNPASPFMSDASYPDGAYDAAGTSIAIAVRSDGGNPWTGTTGSFITGSNGTKRNPVWTTGSVGTRLYVFPRSNNHDGSQNTAKDNTCGWFSPHVDAGHEYTPSNSSKTPTSFMHFFAGPDWLTCVEDFAGVGTVYWNHFGKYVPIPELTGTSYPTYFMASFKGRMANGHGSFDNFMYEFGAHQGFGAKNGGLFDSSTYGGFAGSDFYTDGVSQGGISVPPGPTSGTVRTCHMSLPSIFPWVMNGAVGNFAVTGSAWYDEYVPYLTAGEYPWSTGTVGFLGYAKDFKMALGSLPHMSLNPERTKIAIHGTPTGPFPENYEYQHPMHFSLILPWTSSLLPYQRLSYQGTHFYVP